MGKSLLLTIFVLAGLCQVYAQTGSISGRISGDDSPLEFATISLLKTSYAASSDSNGYYQLNNIPIGKYQLRISYLGYENAQQEVSVQDGKSIAVNLSLIPLSSKLKEVVVTGTLKEVTKLESVTPVDVYSSKFFQRNPVTNLFDGLYSIPGLFADVDNGVSNTTDVQINGLEGNYTMYLIDGVPALSSLAGMYAINAFPMNIIDKVEVVKGASSTLYGSEAIAGVINIKTKDPRNAPRLSANVYLTSMLESYIDLSTRYKLGKSTALLSISTENFNTKWDVDKDGFLDIPYINRVNVYNKIAIHRKDDKKIANVYMRYLFEDRFGGDKTMSPRWQGSTAKYGEAITTHQWQVGFQYQLPVREKIMLQGDYTEHRQDAYYGFTKYRGLQLSGFSQLTWSKKIDNISDFLLGASYRVMYFEDNTPLSDESLTGYARLVHMPAIFFEDEITIARHHTLMLGARVEYSNRSNFAVTPRLNYKWMSPNRKNVLRAGVGTAYRIPNVLNEGIGAMNGSRGIILEEQLKPESVISANLNYTRVQEVKGGLLNIDASVFYTYFFNYIDPEYDEEPGFISYSNSKGATATGFSINADFTFNYPLKVGIGLVYNYVFEVEEEDGEIEREAPAHQPPFIGNFYLSYTFAAPQLSIDWTGNLVTPMVLATVPDDERPEKSPVYTIQNIQVTKKFKNGIDIYFGIKNLFNFIQKDPILRPFDPFNRNTAVDNPNNYRFDTTYGFTTTQGIKGFLGLRYTLQ